ncbi:MAG: hypothetical protein PHY93_21380 [Bacteriovorax sp.]|nr:hypothetical protein [Bacteriovorax sp.]
MKKNKFKIRKFGIAKFLVVALVLGGGLIYGTKMVQQSQENRSSAVGVGMTNPTLYFYNGSTYRCESTTAYKSLASCNSSEYRACFTTLTKCNASDNKCTNYKPGARCQLTTIPCVDGKYISGKCPGNSKIKCCTSGKTLAPANIGPTSVVY